MMLEGRTAVVTGGAHGLGAEFAGALGREGARVVIGDLDAEAVVTTAARLRAEGLDVFGLPLDVSDPDSVETFKQEALTQAGEPDVLVNNAAIMHVVRMNRAGYDGLSVEEWDRMVAVNLRGTWLMCKALVPGMQARGYGKVVNLASGTALKGVAGRIHYVTTKGGVLGFTKTLAREVGDDGVRVNCVAPGSTLSEEDPDEDIMQMRQAAAKVRAIKRMQVPSDLSGAVVFFASPASDFVTGQTLVVDGGNHMH